MNKYHIFFKRLSNKLRIDIISSLAKKPKSVNELCKELKIEQSKLSHALQELRTCQIVQVEKKGKKRIYNVNKTILPVLKMIDIHEKQCCKCCSCKPCEC